MDLSELSKEDYKKLELSFFVNFQRTREQSERTDDNKLCGVILLGDFNEATPPGRSQILSFGEMQNIVNALLNALLWNIDDIPNTRERSKILLFISALFEKKAKQLLVNGDSNDNDTFHLYTDDKGID